jgi:hypothetical protein
MTVCKECSTSLVGEVPVAYEDGPYEAGDSLPCPWETEHPHYDKEVAYIKCPSCGREAPITPRDYYKPPEQL